MSVATELSGRVGYRAMILRNERKLSVEQVSELSGLTPSVIRRVERGNRNFRSHTVCQLSKAFQVDPEYFTIRDIHVAQAMRDPAFAARIATLSQEYFRQPTQETPAA